MLISSKGDQRRGELFSVHHRRHFAAEVHAGDVLEKIIEECARIGVKEFKRAEFQFEGLTTGRHSAKFFYLGVAQLG